MAKEINPPEVLQEKIMEFRFYQEQLEKLNQHLESLSEQAAEIGISIDAVLELEKAKNEQEVLAPLANGIFIQAKLADNKKLIVNVGSNVTVEKTIPEVVRLLEEQQDLINQNIEEAGQVLEAVSHQAQQVYQQIEKLQQ